MSRACVRLRGSATQTAKFGDLFTKRKIPQPAKISSDRVAIVHQDDWWLGTMPPVNQLSQNSNLLSRWSKTRPSIVLVRCGCGEECSWSAPTGSNTKCVTA